MSGSKSSRAPRQPHRPSFGEIERILPAPSSKEAKLLAHILRCEVCADAALSILKIGGGPSKRRGKTDYGSILTSVEARTERVFAGISEQGQRAAEELDRLPDDQSRKQRVQELARVEPWSVSVALLVTASRLLGSEPERAATFAELAAAAATEITPEASPTSLKAGLLVRAHALRGESLRRAGRTQAAERAFARAEGFLSSTTDDQTRSLYCQLLSRLRQVEGRAEEAEALLKRAGDLLGDNEELENFDA